MMVVRMGWSCLIPIFRAARASGWPALCLLLPSLPLLLSPTCRAEGLARPLCLAQSPPPTRTGTGLLLSAMVSWPMESMSSLEIWRRRMTTEAMIPYSRPSSTFQKTVTQKVNIMTRKSTGATHRALFALQESHRGSRD